jgi:hypothetical protein
MATLQGLQLKSRLQNAEVGNFLVLVQNKTHTLWLIRERKDAELVLEEITFPCHLRPSDWNFWLELGAPGALNWLSYRINLVQGNLMTLYSYKEGRFLPVASTQNFLSTLIGIEFNPIPINERRRVGPKPASPVNDSRPYWQPPLYFQGAKQEGAQFDGWRAVWPVDPSELSGKTIELFLLKPNEPYPNYFPYWLQVKGRVAKIQLYVIDSGVNLQSPQPIPQPVIVR